MNSPTLSLCMVVRDEELLVAQAIASVRDVVDEIVVVDTGSIDRTREIVRDFGARLLERPWDGQLGAARNAYLAEAGSDWVLVLDGDEKLAARDAVKLRRLTQRSDVAGYRFVVHNYTRSLDLLCDWHSNRGVYAEEEAFSECPGHSRFPVIRLFRRDVGVRYEEGYSAHTNPSKSLLATGRAIADADIALHHFQYRKGGESFVAEKQLARLHGERRHLEAYPDDALAHLNIGRTLFARGEDAQALYHLDRAVSLAGSEIPARLSRAMARFETGDYEGARADLEAAVHLDPDLGDTWILLGILHHAMEQVTAAEGALERALELRPDHPLALNSLGVLRMDRGDVVAAEALFRRAVQILPEHPMARENLAALLDAGVPASAGDDEQTHRVELGNEADDV